MLSPVRSRAVLAVLATLWTAAAHLGAQGSSVDPTTPAYQAPKGLSGTLAIAGSDTCEASIRNAAAKFQSFHPGVTITIEAKGSATAPPALASGAAQLGVMSRQMKATEFEATEAKLGRRPLETRMCADALVLYVRKENPVRFLSAAQIEAAFAATPRQGGKSAQTWGDLGVTGSLANEPIVIIGHPPTSGSQGAFRDLFLGGGALRSNYVEHANRAAIIQAVRANPAALGYTSLGADEAQLKGVPIGAAAASAVEPTGWNALVGDYVGGRVSYVYRRGGNEASDTLATEFVRFLLSREGQAAFVQGNQLALPVSIVKEEIAKLK